MPYRSVPGPLLRVPSSIRNVPAFMSEYPDGPMLDVPGQKTFARMAPSVTWSLIIQSDMGITLNGTTVSAWADQSGKGNSFSQGTAANQPTYNLNLIGGKPGVTFDGSNDQMSSAGPNLAAPGTTPTFYWGVLRQDTWTAGETLIQANLSGGMQLVQTVAGASPQMSGQNPTAGPVNTGGTVGSFARFELLFNNATSDYLKVGATSVTGTNLGNNDPGAGMFLGRNFGGTVFANFTLAAFGIANAKPLAAELSSLDAWARSYYGSGLLL